MSCVVVGVLRGQSVRKVGVCRHTREIDKALSLRKFERGELRAPKHKEDDPNFFLFQKRNDTILKMNKLPLTLN